MPAAAMFFFLFLFLAAMFTCSKHFPIVSSFVPQDGLMQQAFVTSPLNTRGRGKSGQHPDAKVRGSD